MAESVFITIAGSDASGKATQVGLLESQLREAGREVKTVDFPRYESGSSYFLKRYLGGEYGSLDEIDPRAASIFFALDRLDAREEINEALAAGQIVLSNRYFVDNLAHQGCKIEDEAARLDFFAWLHEMEFEILGIPKPTANLILSVPAEISLRLMRARNAEKGIEADIHEQDELHQCLSRQVYLELCQLYPQDYKRLECVSEDGELLGREAINSLIKDALSDVLAL